MMDCPEREVTAFNAARCLPPEARAACLDEACAGDPALRRRVEELLQASDQAGAFLQEPAPEAQRPAEAMASPAPPATATLPGERVGANIGRYKLLEQIGEGGCGVVYMAEQEEPVRRRVALKVIKLGMDTKQVIARFEAERQALALMDHPNIAKVLDAGATDAGRPYFVMELVPGAKITEFCDGNTASTAERLKLFIQVCQAIQHAHQKGVIHRDIKPSNILVTLNDGVPVPKVIDFGIAKATQGRLTDQTLFTPFEQFIGTPAYMSPEQAMTTSLDIDTRSDTYSLGVLLYELLTGRTPFDAQELLAAGVEEMRRTIREREPLRPSTRLGTLLESELTTTAQRRQVEPAKLLRLVQGDLDWIVMKCLEKDRTRRYDTANGLAMDLQRYLADELVVARPPSRFYRFEKWVRRNKLAFAAAGAVGAALIIGLGVSTWLLLKEREARRNAVAAEKKARTEANKSQQVAGFLKKMLEGVAPSKALGRDTTMLREILDETAKSISNDLTNQPEVEVELRHTLAEIYDELGLYQQMEAMARSSLELARATLGKENEVVASCLGQLGDALCHLGRLDEAERYDREALAMRRRMPGKEHPEVATLLNNLAIVLDDQGKLAEAETVQRESLAMLRRLMGSEHRYVASSLANLAALLDEQGKLPEAESMDREALAMCRKILGNEHPDVASSLSSLASDLWRQGKQAEAETLYREALAMYRKLLGNEHVDVATSLHNLAVVLERQDKLEESETLRREALAIQRKQFGNEDPKTAFSLQALGDLLSRKSALAEAETIYREALEIRKKMLGEDNLDTAGTAHNLADVLRRECKLAEAEILYREALVARRKLLSNEDPATVASRRNLTDLLGGQGRASGAETLLH